MLEEKLKQYFPWLQQETGALTVSSRWIFISYFSNAATETVAVQHSSPY